MHPVRCLSSHFTTELLKFRNPQGSEENWFHGGDRIDNQTIYMGKVIATEFGVALLCLTATVEAVAYGILLCASLPLFVVTSRPIHFFFPLFQSSSFTIYWNLGNFLTFNLFCTNVFTHESLARYSMDHWPRGTAFKLALVMVDLALLTLSVVYRLRYEVFHQHDFFHKPSLRPQDILFLVDWARRHRIDVRLNADEIALANPQIHQLATFIGEVNHSIDAGTQFFKEFILSPNQLDDATKQQVLECEPDAYHFVLTRTIYIYVFGAKKDAPLPSFLKVETRESIQTLRERFVMERRNRNLIRHLEPLMQNLTSFNTEQNNHQIKSIFNDLKGAAHGELQNSLFITKCWQKACNENGPGN
jgi:hypothetical protein